MADALCGRGRDDVAADLARRVAAPDGARLAAFVASRRGRPADAALRRRVEAAEAQNDAKAFATALATIDGIGDGIGDSLAEASAVLGARALAERGTALRRLGRPAEAAAAYVASAARAEAVGWGTWACDCLGLAWGQARLAGDAEGARRAAERAVAVAKAEPDPVREGDAWIRVGRSALAARRPADGVAAFDAAIEAFRRAGSSRGTALALAGAFRARQAVAPPEEVAAAADRLARAWDGRSAWTRDGWTGAALAEACLLLRRDAGAVDAAERLAADGHRDGDRDVEAVGWELAARAHRAAGRPRSAVLAAERSIALRTGPGERATSRRSS